MDILVGFHHSKEEFLSGDKPAHSFKITSDFTPTEALAEPYIAARVVTQLNEFFNCEQNIPITDHVMSFREV